MEKKVTIYDLARELNVSPSTISRALQGHPGVGPELRKTVKRLAAKKAYKVNRNAASLRTKKSRTIAILVPKINDYFFNSVIAGIEIMARENNYTVIISQSNDEYETEVDVVNSLLSLNIDALIVSLSMRAKNYDHFKPFLTGGIPIVSIDRVTQEILATKVFIDDYGSAYLGAAHLIEQGCRNLAAITGILDLKIYSERVRGFRDAIKDHNLPVREEFIYQCMLLSEDGKKAMDHFFVKPEDAPDGIFCSNDTTAIACIQDCRKRGILVPDDVAIVGFSNDPRSEIIEPNLTTIAQPAIEMGRVACEQAILQINKPKSLITSTDIILKTELVIRDSSRRK